MKKNKKILTITSLAMLVSLGVATTAFADTTSTAPASTTKPWTGRGHPGGTKPTGTFVKPAAAGKVTAVNGNTITITTMARKTKSGTATAATTYTVDVTNAKITKGFGSNATTLSVSNIAVNDMIVVQGTVSGTNIAATSIIDGIKFPARPAGETGGKHGMGNFANMTHVMGTVQSVSGTSLVVAEGSVNYTVDATNAKISYGKNTAGTIANIETGDKVFILTPKVASGVTTVTATAIHDSTTH